jgi:hypothetical protein
MDRCCHSSAACLSRHVTHTLVVLIALVLVGSAVRLADGQDVPAANGTDKTKREKEESLDFELLANLQSALRTMYGFWVKGDKVPKETAGSCSNALKLSESYAAQHDPELAEKIKIWMTYLDAEQPEPKALKTAAGDVKKWIPGRVPVNPYGKYFMVNTGVVLLNPYKLTKGTVGGREVFEVESTSGSEYKFSTEIKMKRRYAWSAPADASPWGFVDYDSRFGWVVGEDDPSASTVVGSGDFYLEASLGTPVWPLVRHDKGDFALTLNVEGLGSVATERGVQDLHSQYSAGVALVSGISTPIGGGRPVEALLGLYYGRYEVPRFVDEADLPSSGSILVVSQGGFPDYQGVESWTARADVHVPVGATGAIVVAGRFYLGVDEVNPWSVWIGFTYTGELLTGLFGK